MKTYFNVFEVPLLAGLMCLCLCCLAAVWIESPLICPGLVILRTTGWFRACWSWCDPQQQSL